MISPDTHSYVLFARAAKHAMDDALKALRRAREAPDYWFARQETDLAERLRIASWDHLRAARKARELVA